MASEASVAGQTTDEQIVENKVIDDAKIVEEASVSQPKEPAGDEIEKREAKEQENPGTSATNSNEIIEKKVEASAAKEVKKEDEADEASESGVLEDKSYVSPAADETKKGNVDSEASDSKILEDNKGGASVVADVKVKAEIGKISSPCDAEVEASVREPEEKSLTTAKPLSEAVDTTLVDSSLTSVQESEQVAYEREISKPLVEIVKTTEESFDVSANSTLSSETIDKSREPLIVPSVTEPAPDATGIPEGDLEQVGYEPEVSEAAVEIAKTTGEPASETVAKSEEQPINLTVAEPEAIGEPEVESEQVGHEPEVSDPAVEKVKTTGVSLDVSANPAPASETAVISEEHPKDITVTESTPETIGEPEIASEQVAHEPEASNTDVEIVKTTEESLDVSADPNLSSENPAISDKHPEAISVTGPTPESIREPERVSEQVGQKPEVSDVGFETVKTTGESFDVSANPAPASETIPKSEEQSISLTVTEPTPDERELEQVDEPGVSKPITEIIKTTGECLVFSADPAPASETAATPTSEEHLKVIAVTDPSLDANHATRELERKNEISEVHEVVEASNNENILAVDVQAASGSLKEESAVETGSSTSQALNTVPDDSAEVKGNEDVEGSHSVSKNMDKGSDDAIASGCPVETKNDENVHTAAETLEKKVTGEPSLSNPSIAVDKTDAINATSTTEASVIPGGNVEEHMAERILEGYLVKEQKEEKIVEVKLTEEKAVETGSTLPATNETGDQVELEVTEASSKEEKPCKGADKTVLEQDFGVSDSETKTTDNMEEVRASEVDEEFAKEPKHENQNVKDDTQTQTSRDRDLRGQSDKANMSNEEPVVKLEEAEKSDIANVEGDGTSVVKLEEAQKSSIDTVDRAEAEEKKDETEKTDAQNVVESSKESAVSKTDLEVHKAEPSGKPSKTLMSKVKHSIGKVKKAIIGKSPSSKTMSAESKDELKVK